MDFSLTEDQEMLRRSALDFLQRECPRDLVRRLQKDEEGYSLELWRKIAELGWMGLIFPEEYGGSGGDFLDLTVLLVEMGRVLLPGPFVSTVVCCGLPILLAGNEEQKRDFLPKIAKGDLIMTLALTEPSANYHATGIELKATPINDEYVLNGIKLFVPDAHIAHWLLVVARTAEGPTPEEGITNYLVNAKSQGISHELLKTIGFDRQCEVMFQDVKVPKMNIVGEVNKGWDVIGKLMQHAALAQCALMLGGAERVLEMTVNYSKERKQFGHPIGSFQSIQHTCAEMAIELDSMRYITYQTAWKLSRGISASVDLSIAKAWVSKTYRDICLKGHQVHGAIGTTWEHDMQLYFRRAAVAEMAFGDAEFHKDMLARQLGFPTTGVKSC